MAKTQAIILAAGKGSRMKSSTPKALHLLSGKTLLRYVVDTAINIDANINIVIGHNAELVKNSIMDANVNWILQKEQLGTAHAVQQAIADIADDDICLILYADVPLIKDATLQKLIKEAKNSNIAILISVVSNPYGYGRIKRNVDDNIIAIIEQQDANDKDLDIKEINTGVMAIKKSLLADNLMKIEANNNKNEFYLTDIIKIANANNIKIVSYLCNSKIEVMGVNDKKQLAELERITQQEQAEEFMLQGLCLKDHNRFDCRGKLNFSKDCIIDVNVVFEGDNELGENVFIAPNCVIKDAKIGDNVVIKANTVIESSTIGNNVTIGPFARIRPQTVIANNAKIGNFTELKNSQIGDGSKISHLSYLGDSIVGDDVNIGAGVITCNYDGENKHQTIIQDQSFIGANSQLIAPVTIGKNAKVAAGSTITKDVLNNSLAISRCEQKTLKNFKKSQKNKK